MRSLERSLPIALAFVVMLASAPSHAADATSARDVEATWAVRRAAAGQLGAGRADADGDGLAEDLERTIERDGVADAIVLLDRPADEATVERLRVQTQIPRPRRRFASVGGFALSLTGRQADALARRPEVRGVYLDRVVRAHLNTATASQGVPAARSDLGVDGSRDGSSTYSRDDVVVAVIDTGIDADHVDLDGGKVLAFVDCTQGPGCVPRTPFDDNFHGTLVASIVAGEGDADPRFRGVAPRAALVGVKVLDADGVGTESEFLDGLDWVIANRVTYGIDLVNMSLGADGCSDGNDPIAVATDSLFELGMLPVAAAGNSGPDPCTVGSPAAARKALAVGWAADTGESGIFLAPESSRGPTFDGRVKPDLVAPGERITGAHSPDVRSDGRKDRYVTGTGSSMASPFVAGVAALMLDARPASTPANLRDWIVASAQDWGVNGKDPEYGWGVIRAYEAVRRAAGAPQGIPPWPMHQYLTGTASPTSPRVFRIDVEDTSLPMAVTIVVRSFNRATGTPDLEMRLSEPDGDVIVDTGPIAGAYRSQAVGGPIAETGTYRLEVYSQAGTGTFDVDVSWGGAGSTLLAEGATHSGFDTYLAFANADVGHRSAVDVELLTKARGVVRPAAFQGVQLAAGGTATVRADTAVPSDDLGARITSGARPVVTERLLRQTGSLAFTDAVSVPEPSSSWFVAEGATHSGFATFLLVSNPGAVSSSVSVTFLTPSGPVSPPSLQEVALGAGRRLTVPVGNHVAGSDVSTRVTATQPVLAEFSMSKRTNDLAMAGSFGVPAAATSWFLADGATHSGFNTFLLLANPQEEAATVDVTLLTKGDGPVRPSAIQDLTVPANSRVTVPVDRYVPADDVAVEVSSDVPVVAERSIHKQTAQGFAIYDSVGLTTTGERWVNVVPGEAGVDAAFVLVAIPAGAAGSATVRVTFLSPSGPVAGPLLTVAPGSRATTRIPTELLGAAAGALVESQNGIPIAAEMSVHADRGASGLAIGGSIASRVP